jgi:hypothetical protein
VPKAVALALRRWSHGAAPEAVRQQRLRACPQGPAEFCQKEANRKRHDLCERVANRAAASTQPQEAAMATLDCETIRTQIRNLVDEVIRPNAARIDAAEVVNETTDERSISAAAAATATSAVHSNAPSVTHDLPLELFETGGE